MTKSQHSRHVLKHTTVLRSTLNWPEGPQDVCAVCGEMFRTAQRVCVVDRHYYAQEQPEGLYAHAMCVQEKCRDEGDGTYVPVSRIYGGTNV